MASKKIKDEANLKAANQEAEERRLKRKKAMRKPGGTLEGPGVSFDEDAPSEANGEILDSEISKETLSSEPVKKGKQRTIKIQSDGTYEGTTVYIGTLKLKHPDISIRISKESGVKVVFVKEESLF